MTSRQEAIAFVNKIINEYEKSEKGVISEFSGDISGDNARLHKDVKALKQEARRLIMGIDPTQTDLKAWIAYMTGLAADEERALEGIDMSFLCAGTYCEGMQRVIDDFKTALKEWDVSI